MTAEHQTAMAALSEERDLASRVADGDRGAETEFVHRYERGVRVLMRRHCRPSDPVVDDLVQDVLSSVIERMRAGAIRDTATLPAYVQAAVVYAASAEYRRRRPTETLAVIEDLSSDASPTDSLSNAQLAAMLRSSLAELPIARDRQILVRFYLDELPKHQVCEELGIDPTHFHRVVFRARNRLRELIELSGMGNYR